jgi:hypothetical protein
MGQVLILFAFYAICASAVLVGSTLLERRDLGFQPRCVAISDYLLVEWAARVPDLVILDVHLDRGIDGWNELVCYWLATSPEDLPSLLKWLPPASIVVFCCREATMLLDARSKTSLDQAGIGTIYFLEDSAVFQANHRCDNGIMTQDANRELHKSTMRETRQGL